MERTEAVVVVGAGPAGASAALEASRRGMPVILLDSAAFPRDKVCGDALSGKVVDGLKRLGIDPLKFLGNEPASLASWGIEFTAPSGEGLRIPFRSAYNPLTDAPPGYIMPRFDFDARLVQHAVAQPLVEFRPRHKVIKVGRSDDWITLEIDGGRNLKTRAVIAADGVHSVVRRLIDARPWPARHHCAGVRAYYEQVSGLNENGFIELHFLPELLPGYLWIFPLGSGKANVGLGMRSDVVARKRVSLRKLLTKLLLGLPQFKSRFIGARPLGPPSGLGLPLGSRRSNLAGPGILRCGDAANLIDPFTGEGIGNAMLSGRLAGQQMALAWGAKVYHADVLKQYPQLVWNKLGNELRISSGLQYLSRWPWLFNRFVRQANRHEELKQVLMCMFEDVNLRSHLTRPSFYYNWLLG
jgi:geranylgeranyl reductase family protein